MFSSNFWILLLQKSISNSKSKKLVRKQFALITFLLFHFAGFLNTNINPGRKPRMANYGLMDQIAALKWIQENIQYFGGNPKSVTLFGHNRGAACIHYLMQSPVVVPGKHMHFFIILFFGNLIFWKSYPIFVSSLF